MWEGLLTHSNRSEKCNCKYRLAPKANLSHGSVDKRGLLAVGSSVLLLNSEVGSSSDDADNKNDDSEDGTSAESVLVRLLGLLAVVKESSSTLLVVQSRASSLQGLDDQADSLLVLQVLFTELVVVPFVGVLLGFLGLLVVVSFVSITVVEVGSLEVTVEQSLAPVTGLELFLFLVLVLLLFILLLLGLVVGVGVLDVGVVAVKVFLEDVTDERFRLGVVGLLFVGHEGTIRLRRNVGGTLVVSKDGDFNSITLGVTDETRVDGLSVPVLFLDLVTLGDTLKPLESFFKGGVLVVVSLSLVLLFLLLFVTSELETLVAVNVLCDLVVGEETVTLTIVSILLLSILAILLLSILLLIVLAILLLSILLLLGFVLLRVAVVGLFLTGLAVLLLLVGDVVSQGLDESGGVDNELHLFVVILVVAVLGLAHVEEDVRLLREDFSTLGISEEVLVIQHVIVLDGKRETAVELDAVASSKFPLFSLLVELTGSGSIRLGSTHQSAAVDLSIAKTAVQLAARDLLGISSETQKGGKGKRQNLHSGT